MDAKELIQKRISEEFDRYLVILSNIPKERVKYNREYIEGIYHNLLLKLDEVSNENYSKGLEIENKIRILLGGSLNDISSHNYQNKFYLHFPQANFKEKGILQRIL